jgi:DNA-binding response OmpR family regulator
MASKKILLVDDMPSGSRYLVDRLQAQGYLTELASSGPAALEAIQRAAPDLVLLDVVMPGMSGYEVCREIRRNPATEALPVIMVTALDPAEERVRGLEAGADEFLSAPVHWPELLARVRSLLRVKELLDTVRTQARQLEELNRTLEAKVREQVQQIECLNRLRRFLSPQVAELVVSMGSDCLESHRRDIAVVCCDLRNFTAFAERAEPEETINVLRQYHRVIGGLVTQYDGTLDHFSGDGVVVFFNDPIPCERPARQATGLAVLMQRQVGELIVDWRHSGHDLGFGVGVAAGFATVGLVGYEGRHEYAATGSTVCLAARFCERARDGQVLLGERVRIELGSDQAVKYLGDLSYKGFATPVPTYMLQARS